VDPLWREVLQIVQQQVSPQNFEIWFKPIRMLELQDETANLAVPNKFFKDWLDENYLPLLKEALRRAVGRECHVSFHLYQETDLAMEEGQDSDHDPFHRQEKRQRVHPQLNERYSFERFVVGSSNQLAHAAAISVAEQPAKNYNPLFIYGGVGLGKTHLLNAIGLRVFNLYQDMNIVYVSAEAFMNELINSIRCDTMPKFREKYRNVECLLIDDIQFIAGKERTQEEFFHTFNTLHDAGKQIVVTSDKFPKEIPNLENRLRSRFEWGLIADIQQPDIETKIAIILKKHKKITFSYPIMWPITLPRRRNLTSEKWKGFS